MKKKLFCFCAIFVIYFSEAQESYNINGETITLKTEVDGHLDLLWNVIDNQYRYFIRTSDNTITELTNTRNDEGDYQEEYKTTLANATNGAISAAKVNLTLPSLITYIETYNKQQDAGFTSTHPKNKLDLRLAIFGGITNSPFVNNPDNAITPVFGAELEVAQDKEQPRHSGFLQLRHVFKDEDKFPYETTELSLGYRYRFFSNDKFNIFADVKAATLNISKATVVRVDEDDNPYLEDISETAFDVPFVFGLGVDFKISDRGFVTFGYNQLFAAFLDNQDNFSTDFTIGYRFKL